MSGRLTIDIILCNTVNNRDNGISKNLSHAYRREKIMPYRYRKPSIKIGGTTIRRNKKGYSFSSKTLFGGRKTYNTATGKTTRTYKTGIKGLSYYTVSGGKKRKASRTTGNRTTSYNSNYSGGYSAPYKSATGKAGCIQSIVEWIILLIVVAVILRACGKI